MYPQNGTAAWGYDAMSLLATAMENAGTLEPTVVRDALANITDYQGASVIAGYDAGSASPQKQCDPHNSERPNRTLQGF